MRGTQHYLQRRYRGYLMIRLTPEQARVKVKAPMKPITAP
jgi:hypothetical protein